MTHFTPLLKYNLHKGAKSIDDGDWEKEVQEWTNNNSVNVNVNN